VKSRTANPHIPHHGAVDLTAGSSVTTDVAPFTGGAGLSIRRWFLVASPVLAGLFAILGAASDPAVGQDGVTLWKAYAENPEPLQFKSFGLHWGFAFWLVPTLLIAGLVRGRGVWIANVAAFLGFVGISTLPGLLVVDFYDSAIGQVAGVQTTAQVNEAAEGMWAVAAIVTPGIVGFVLSLPLAAVAAWRAGLVRWWGPVAVVAGYVAFSGVSARGTVLTTVCFSVFAYELARGTRTAHRGLADPPVKRAAARSSRATAASSDLTGGNVERDRRAEQ
jgi:hypothetical protein